MTQLSVVTGGSGFVGRHLVDGLLARGDRVRVVDLSKPHRDDVEHVAADITDVGAVTAAMAGADSVFHNASVVHTKQNQQDFVWKVNLEGTRNVMAGCRAGQVPKLVYVSSGSVVYEGKDIENGDESLPYSTISQAPYADSKIAAEREILAKNREGGVATVALRPHVIFRAARRAVPPAVIAHARQAACAGRSAAAPGSATTPTSTTSSTRCSSPTSASRAPRPRARARPTSSPTASRCPSGTS
ncbi:MAG: NAD-dependent epimerase/dehydratase family protein [Sandaracinaceae bacterium]